MRHPQFHLLTSLGALAIIGTAIGCSRQLYRKKADRDAYGAIQQKVEALDLTDFLVSPSIEPNPESRLFDPSNPDHPSMPPDDPRSHEFMRRVDGKKGASKWAPLTERENTPDAAWRKILSEETDSKRLVLNLRRAMRVARLNSRDFQHEKEDLYLSALDLTFERFQFSPKLALGSTGRAEADGKKSAGTLSPGASHGAALTDGSVRWMAATGGELLAGFANSFVWSFNGQNGQDTASSVVNFSLVQPLLRLGGRTETLERLTQSERTLLANVRQMEQFQSGFYVRVVAGRNSGEGPTRSPIVGGNGLGLIAGTPSGRAVAPSAGGFLALLEGQQRIQNQESNVARLRESLDQLAAAFNAGRISSRLQVDQARQALFAAQSNLLSAKAAYETQFDNYKVDLGLPPELPIEVQDTLLDRFKVSDPTATLIDRKLSNILAEIRTREIPPSHERIQKSIRDLFHLEPELKSLLATAKQNLSTFRSVIPIRKAQLIQLKEAPETDDLSIEPEPLDPARLDTKLKLFTERTSAQNKDLSDIFTNLQGLETDLAGLEPVPARSKLTELATQISGLLLSISLNQTAIRLESAVLPEINLSEEKALAVARDHRLDWMNARARLVDSWRQVDRMAHALQSGLTLSIKGSMGTIRDNQPASFDARTGMLQANLRFDTPLNRLAERNDYREAQIEYQRARRDYMLFEDKVSQSLRNTLRITKMSALNFELRRAAVQVAIAQVDLARLRLDEPPKPGAVSQFGATTARDLVSALSDLLDAQNDFLSIRVGYDVLRLVLDFELGTMHTDGDGLWVDPGSITESQLATRTIPWREMRPTHAGITSPTTTPNPSSASMALVTFRHASPSVR